MTDSSATRYGKRYRAAARFGMASSVQEFHDATRPGTRDALVEAVADRLFPGRRSDTPEIRSWRASWPELADILTKAGLQRLWIAVEYRPYQAGNSRADAVVAGFGPDGRPVYLVVELKQWQQAGWDAANERVTGTGAGYERAHGLHHPYDQAHDYSQFIRSFTQGMHDENAVTIAAAAYLHNATEDSIETLRTAGRHQADGTFSGDPAGRERFIGRLATLFDPGRDGAQAWENLSRAAYQQGPKLLEAAARIFADRDSYPLTDEQYDVFGRIQNAVSAAMNPSADRDQAVIVVKGGPGTGKTWIAMHLLGANAHARRQVSYSTNSGSLRSALQTSAGFNSLLGAGPAGQLITSARIYHDYEERPRKLDLLIVDEAQRLEQWTVLGGHANSRVRQDHLESHDITQLFELKKSAKVLVLFIDEDQASTSKDFVTIDHARELADRTGASFDVMELTEQHRSGGSQAYEAWVDALLDGEPVVWHDEENFTVSVAGTPQDLEQMVFDDAAGGDARLLAGFCWDWRKRPKIDSIHDLPFDIEIGEWRKHWNLHKALSGHPKHTDWARKPSGSAQVGSIFTAQGFEFPRVGVIVGPDLVWDDAAGRMAVDMGASRYTKLVQLRNKNPHADVRIRNQYRVLLTRAMRSVVLYSTDPGTQALLRRIVNPAPA
ncbi:DNA/RNA helicase domain-containing protein [Actinoplanes sp. NPDC049548]|uniref:DNA/RNA helicase domain-containing protein n=1 Tax=Actinoplanes sp. NPDC049548 TaxID=3155152 RepID=UPI003439D7EC